MATNPFYKASDFLQNSSVASGITGLSSSIGALNSDISSTVSDLALRGSVSSNQRAGQVKQTERLKSARPRYARQDQMYVNGVSDGLGQDLGGNRGQWAYIKLLTSEAQAKEYASGNTKRDLTYKNLVGRGGIAHTMARTDLPTDGYDGFMITSVTCSMSEKVQVSEVFGDNEVVYYFGRQPLIFSIGGILIDSVDNDWLYDWLTTYSDFLRGTKTAKNYELVKLVLPNMAITGTISAFNWSQDASRDTDIPFQIQFIAKVVEPFAASGTDLVTSNVLRGVDFSQVSAFVSQRDINSLRGQVASLTGVLQDPSSTLQAKGQALSALGTGVGGTFGDFLEQSRNTLTEYQDRIDGWTQSANSAGNDIRSSALFQSVTSSLMGIRANLFSPVYGVLSSLMKLVSNFANSASLLSSVVVPVRNILRDITTISNKAVALVNLVNNSILGVGRNTNGQLRGLTEDYKAAIKALDRAAGVIAAAPVTASQSVRDMFSSAALSPNSAFLASTPKLSFLRPSLELGGGAPVSKLNLLLSTPVYSAPAANTLEG